MSDQTTLFSLTNWKSFGNKLNRILIPFSQLQIFNFTFLPDSALEFASSILEENFSRLTESNDLLVICSSADHYFTGDLHKNQFNCNWMTYCSITEQICVRAIDTYSSTFSCESRKKYFNYSSNPLTFFLNEFSTFRFSGHDNKSRSGLGWAISYKSWYVIGLQA